MELKLGKTQFYLAHGLSGDKNRIKTRKKLEISDGILEN
jgi:hypothetical protein